MFKVANSWPFLLMLFINLVFFYKFLFYGLLPIPSDLIVGGYYPWLDYKWGYPAGVPVKNPILSDAVSVIYPIKALAVDLVKNGELPYWNWHMFGSYPLLANLQLGLLFPSMLFYLFFSQPIAWSLQIIIQPLLSIIFMYLFLRHLSLKKLASLFGAISYGFGGFSMIWLEWNSLSAASSFLPLLILMTDKILKDHQRKWSFLFSLILALQILSGYPQLVIFSLISIFGWLLFKKTPLKIYIKFLFFILLGIGLTSIILLPGFELYINSQRKVEVIEKSVRFLPWQNLISLLAPDFFGNHTTGNFWGAGNYTLMTIYSGAITFILALIPLFNFKKNQTPYFIFLFILTLIIITPNPLSTYFFNLGIWGGQAASPTRGAFLINFCLASLSAFGLSKINSIKVARLLRIPFYMFISLSAIGIGLVLSKYFLQTQLPDNLNQEPYQIIFTTIENLRVSLRNLILPLGLIACSAVLILLSKKLSKTIIQLLFIIFIIFELFRFGWKFNAFNSANFLYPDTPITNFLQKNPGQRVLGGDVIPANMWLPYNIESAEGYDAAYPINWARFISVLSTNDPKAKSATRYGLINSYNNKLLDLTSSRYLLALKRVKNRVDEGGQVGKEFQIPKFKKVFEDKSVVVLENTKTLPRSFIVTRVDSVKEDEIFKRMLEEDFLISQQAIISDSSEYVLNFESRDEFPLPEYERLSNNHVRVTTSTPKRSFLVVLDSFYPGWKVFIDDQAAKLFRTNFTFRGVFLPAGKHKVDFVYYPRSLTFGVIISFLSLLTLIVMYITNFSINEKS